MRKLAFIVAALAVFAVTSSLAAETYSASLTSTDAGTTNTAAIRPGQDYVLQCAGPACFKTGSDTPVGADCTQDFVIDERVTLTATLTGSQTPDGGGTWTGYATTQTGTTVQVPPYHTFGFASGRSRYVAARALDGGNPSCRLFEKNTR